MERKAIFGGTFDPIHNGHLYIAYEALYNLNLDKIIFMPSGIPPHKINEGITDSHIRYDMVKTAIKEEKKFEISDYEIKKSGFSYTYETLEYFNKVYGKNTELYFIVGSDCLVNLNTWKNVDRILNSCTLVVFGRPGYDKEIVLKHKLEIETKFKKNIIFLDLLNLEISSSIIRDYIRDGKKVYYFLPQSVNEKIQENELYK